jgi:hypothetical protein
MDYLSGPAEKNSCNLGSEYLTKRLSLAVGEPPKRSGRSGGRVMPEAPLPRPPRKAGFLETPGIRRRGLKLSASQLAATAGEDRRPVGQTCALLLATAGGRTSDAAAVRGDAGPDRAVADTHGIESYWGKSAAASRSTTGLGEGEVLQEWQKIGQFSAVLVRISDCWGRAR